MSRFKSKFRREIGVGIALVSDGYLIFPIEVSNETRKKSLSSHLLYFFMPYSKRNTIVFVILKGEPIPKDQKAVVSSPITVEYLLPRVSLLRSRHNEIAVVLLIPPVELHPCFELTVHQRLRLAVGLLAAFVN
jgi:hypothetical protein